MRKIFMIRENYTPPRIQTLIYIYLEISSAKKMIHSILYFIQYTSSCQIPIYIVSELDICYFKWRKLITMEYRPSSLSEMMLSPTKCCIFQIALLKGSYIAKNVFSNSLKGNTNDRRNILTKTHVYSLSHS